MNAFSACSQHHDSKQQTILNVNARLEKVSLVLVQALTWILGTQNADGSWGDLGPMEETAYAILALVKLFEYELFESLFAETISRAIERGKGFISKHKGREPEQLWIEKISYGSEYVSLAYKLAASLSQHSKKHIRGLLDPEVRFNDKKRTKWLRMAESLPMLKEQPTWILSASFVEATLFLPLLEAERNVVFDRKGFSKDRYITFIAAIWTTARNVHGQTRATTSDSLLVMMLISVLNYQVDEYMERMTDATNSNCHKTFEDVRHDITMIFAKVRKTTNSDFGDRPLSNGNNKAAKDMPQDGEVLYDEALVRFIEFILYHPSLAGSSVKDQCWLLCELECFLKAHVDQSELSFLASPSIGKREIDSTGNCGPSAAKCSPSLPPFKKWVRSTAAEHTSCLYSFAFAACLHSANGEDLFSTVQQSYLADDVCRHLATMCRIYNDYGSLQRDRDEQNLNSLDFSEFSCLREDVELAKQDLLCLGNYERSCLENALHQLEKTRLAPGALDWMRIFITVTDMFGEIYVREDIASRRLDA